MRGWLAFLLVLRAVGALFAQEQDQQWKFSASKSLNDSDLETFFDPLFRARLAHTELPGAAMIVVRDDQVLFQKGYGFADYGRTKPVDPNKTVFYAASLSKLFVATAVMQLVEAGQLAVGDDVNKHFRGFRLANSFAAPVTIANLLTHTGGLDEHMLGTEVPALGPKVSLQEYFAHRTPPRNLPPGDQINYSNHGMALAGNIVEEVSGQPFYEYVESHIFIPLKMFHSTFRQPLPKEFAASVAMERFAKAQLIPYPPATLATTAADMGRFLMAHVNGGALDEARILKTETVAEMHRQHFTSHPHMPGVAYGFFETEISGRRVLFHTGSRDHQSALAIVPKERLGIFVVMSGTDAEGAFCGDTILAFLKNRFAPTKDGAEIAPGDNSKSSADVTSPSEVIDQFVGRYRCNLASRTTVEKIAALGMEVNVRRNDQGRLTMQIPGLERPGSVVELTPVEPLLFRTSTGGYASLRRNKSGAVTDLFSSGEGLRDPMSFERVPWYATAAVHKVLFAVGGGMAVFFMLSATLIGVVRLAKRGRLAMVDHLPWKSLAALCWWAALLTSILMVASPLVGLALMRLTTERQLYNIPPILHASLGLLLLASALGITLPVLAVVAWTRKFWTLGERLLFSAMAACGGALLPMLHYWNLLGYRF
jgi:CubicO group peptidase (beta-lactamase class C family)